MLGIKLKSQLQQYLPFTVLKQSYFRASNAHLSGYNSTYRLRYWNVLTRIIEQREKIVTTVLTVYGIETKAMKYGEEFVYIIVATVLTVYGIETQLPLYQDHNSLGCNSTYRLRYWNFNEFCHLECHIPSCNSTYRLRYWNVSDTILSMNLTELVATVLTVYGIE